MKFPLALKDRKRLLDTPSYYAVELVQDPDGPCMKPASAAEMHAMGMRLANDPTKTVEAKSLAVNEGKKLDDGRKHVKLVTVDSAPLLFSLGPSNLSFALAAILTDAEPLNDNGEPCKVWSRAEAARVIPPGKQTEVLTVVAKMMTAAIRGDEPTPDASAEVDERPTPAATGDAKP